MSQITLAILCICPAALVCQNAERVQLRQCRWSPHTVAGQNGMQRILAPLNDSSVGGLFRLDSLDDWYGFTDDLSSLRADYLVPKWLFKNPATQLLLTAALLPDKIISDRDRSRSLTFISAWNVLLCGAYKFYSDIEVHKILSQKFQKEEDIHTLVDILFRLARCVESKSEDDCPSVCSADSAYVKPCHSIKFTKQVSSCQLTLDPDLDYTPFKGTQLPELRISHLSNELDDLLQWLTTLPEEKRLPTDMFKANLDSDFLVRVAMLEVVPPDPDEMPVELDGFFKSVADAYKDKCLNPEAAEESKCLHFRGIVHSKLVQLQKRLVSDRRCRCITGYKWDDETESCVQSLSGYCQDSNPCLNGGQCRAETVKDGKPDVIGVQRYMVIAHCSCTPAWGGDHCELEVNVCNSLPSTSTCGEHECKRSTAFVDFGFVCICPPQTHVRVSDTDPRCRDLNECQLQPGVCKNDGECRNADPGFVCVCQHGYAGPRCEVPPESPHWADWGRWSRCLLPEKALACSEYPTQIRTRQCQAEGVTQHCEGPQRQMRFLCPGEMNKWDLTGCAGADDGNDKSASQLHSEADHDDNEEVGRVSDGEILRARASETDEYFGHFLLLFCTMMHGCFTLLLGWWCCRRLLRPLGNRVAKRLVAKMK